MVRRRRCVLGRLDVRGALDRSYSSFSYFNYPVSEFSLTYNIERIDASEGGVQPWVQRRE
jgi:hypothetical protein